MFEREKCSLRRRFSQHTLDNEDGEGSDEGKEQA
jgi:hypothetical protein